MMISIEGEKVLTYLGNRGYHLNCGNDTPKVAMEYYTFSERRHLPLSKNI